LHALCTVSHCAPVQCQLRHCDNPPWCPHGLLVCAPHDLPRLSPPAQVYVVYFKTNKKFIHEYPNLREYVRDVYQVRGRQHQLGTYGWGAGGSTCTTAAPQWNDPTMTCHNQRTQCGCTQACSVPRAVHCCGCSPGNQAFGGAGCAQHATLWSASMVT
jgi:hypothetical protein